MFTTKKKDSTLNGAKKDPKEQDLSIIKREKNNWQNLVTCEKHYTTH